MTSPRFDGEGFPPPIPADMPFKYDVIVGTFPLPGTVGHCPGDCTHAGHFFAEIRTSPEPLHRPEADPSLGHGMARRADMKLLIKGPPARTPSAALRGPLRHAEAVDARRAPPDPDPALARLPGPPGGPLRSPPSAG